MKAYQLKIQIKDSHPPIWRRVIVPAGLSFSQLGVVLNKVMGWCGYHLFSFEFYHLNLRFEESMEEEPLWCKDDIQEASEYLIDTFLEAQKWFSYIYDFGDNWEHRVTVEKVLMDYGKNYPVVVKYKGETPYEDCGGIYGYYDLLEILKNPKHKEYKNMKAWTEGHFTSRPYDLEKVNQELASLYISKEKSEPMSSNEIYEDLLNGKPLKQIQGSYELPEEEGFWEDWEEWPGESGEEMEELDANTLKEIKKMLGDFDKNIRKDAENAFYERSERVMMESILSFYGKEDLKEIARVHSLSGYSKYKKQDLISFVRRHLLSKNVMQRYFFYLNESEMKMLEEAQGADTSILLDGESPYLLRGGYCGCLEMGKFLIPWDVLEAYKENCGEDWKKERKERVCLLYYLNAAAEMYGICPIDTFIELYHGHMERDLGEWDILNFAEEVPDGKKRFQISGRDIVLADLNQRNVLDDLKKVQGNKPYYIMTEDEVVTLGGEGYFPFDMHMLRFRDFLVETLMEEARDAEILCRETQYAIRTGVPLEDIVKVLQEEVMVIEEEDVKKLANLIYSVCMHTRRVDLRGNLPAAENMTMPAKSPGKTKKEKIIDFSSYKK